MAFVGPGVCVPTPGWEESIDSHRLRGVKKVRHITIDHRTRVWIMYIIVLSLNFLTVNELSTERYFIVWAVKLNLHVYYKGILISEFEPKNMLLWKRDSFLFSQKIRTRGLLSRKI